MNGSDAEAQALIDQLPDRQHVLAANMDDGSITYTESIEYLSVRLEPMLQCEPTPAPDAQRAYAAFKVCMEDPTSANLAEFDRCHRAAVYGAYGYSAVNVYQPQYTVNACLGMVCSVMSQRHGSWFNVAGRADAGIEAAYARYSENNI